MIRYQHKKTGRKYWKFAKGVTGQHFYCQELYPTEDSIRIPADMVEGCSDWIQLANPVLPETKDPTFTLEEIQLAMMKITNHAETYIGKQKTLLDFLKNSK